MPIIKYSSISSDVVVIDGVARTFKYVVGEVPCMIKLDGETYIIDNIEKCLRKYDTRGNTGCVFNIERTRKFPSVCTLMSNQLYTAIYISIYGSVSKVMFICMEAIGRDGALFDDYCMIAMGRNRYNLHRNGELCDHGGKKIGILISFEQYTRPNMTTQYLAAVNGRTIRFKYERISIHDTCAVVRVFDGDLVHLGYMDLLSMLVYECNLSLDDKFVKWNYKGKKLLYDRPIEVIR